MTRARLRDLGFAIGRMPTGKYNAITDVPGTLVGHTTLIHDDPHVARTGVTVVVPREGEIWNDGAFCGCFSFNGSGEMTGIPWIEESGMLTSIIGITNTHQVGLVRDALVEYSIENGYIRGWVLPVVAETYDGFLSDIDAFHLNREHVFQAIASASGGVTAEGNVGGGTGMLCHGFKGGIGTSSRLVETRSGQFTVGALVQANYGSRADLRVNGVPVGMEIGPEAAPLPGNTSSSGGSIIIIVGTDAPLLSIQCQRLARRATVGLSRAGGSGHNGSGDIFLAFSTLYLIAGMSSYVLLLQIIHKTNPFLILVKCTGTSQAGHRRLSRAGGAGHNSSGDIFLAFSTGNHVTRTDVPLDVKMLPLDHISPLFDATAEAVEESIINALTSAETMTGLKGRTAHALPLEELGRVMRKYGF